MPHAAPRVVAGEGRARAPSRAAYGHWRVDAPTLTSLAVPPEHECGAISGPLAGIWHKTASAVLQSCPAIFDHL